MKNANYLRCNVEFYCLCCKFSDCKHYTSDGSGLCMYAIEPKWFFWFKKYRCYNFDAMIESMDKIVDDIKKYTVE